MRRKELRSVDNGGRNDGAVGTVKDDRNNIAQGRNVKPFLSAKHATEEGGRSSATTRREPVPHELYKGAIIRRGAWEKARSAVEGWGGEGPDIVNVMNRYTTMKPNCGAQCEGLDWFDVREQLWADMEGAGLAGEIVSLLVSKQWFVQAEGMGAKALESVKSGD